MPKKSKKLGPEGTPFLSDPAVNKFSEAYPEIEEIDLLMECSNITGQDKGKYHFTKSNMPSYVDCGNPECHGGGYSTQEIINQLYYAKPRLTEKEGHVVCRGQEIIGVRGVGTRACWSLTDFKVKIKYKT